MEMSSTDLLPSKLIQIHNPATLQRSRGLAVTCTIPTLLNNYVKLCNIMTDEANT